MMLKAVRMQRLRPLRRGQRLRPRAATATRGSSRAPIVLVGGRNGAGKTTLLEAVRLALYGPARARRPRLAVGLRRPSALAHPHRAGRPAPIPRRRQSNSTSTTPRAAWSTATAYAGNGPPRGAASLENLEVEKDGAMLASVPREEWQQFLQELIPPGVSQLFFFDGEKIQEIADGEADNEQLAQAVRGPSRHRDRWPPAQRHRPLPRPAPARRGGRPRLGRLQVGAARTHRRSSSARRPSAKRSLN